jgi:hypothetical protein
MVFKIHQEAPRGLMGMPRWMLFLDGQSPNISMKKNGWYLGVPPEKWTPDFSWDESTGIVLGCSKDVQTSATPAVQHQHHPGWVWHRAELEDAHQSWPDLVSGHRGDFYKDLVRNVLWNVRNREISATTVFRSNKPYISIQIISFYIISYHFI